MVGNWVIVMVGWMLFCECSSLKCLAPLKNQASLWSTASIWAATGRWAPRDHCTSLDPFFNEGAMRPSDHQIQGLGSRNALKYTEVAFPSMSKIAVDPWVLHIPDIPGSRIHFWYFCMSSSGVCVHISQKTQHLEAKWLPTCHHLHAKWLLIFGGLVLCQVLIFDIDSPACDGAPPAPRIVLLPQMWTQGHCEGMERKGHMRTHIIPEFVQIKRLENMSHLEKWLCSWQKTGGKCKYRVKSSRSTDVKLHHSRRGLSIFSCPWHPETMDDIVDPPWLHLLWSAVEVKSHLVLRRFASRSKGGMGGDSVHENVSIYTVYIYYIYIIYIYIYIV